MSLCAGDFLNQTRRATVRVQATAITIPACPLAEIVTHHVTETAALQAHLGDTVYILLITETGEKLHAETLFAHINTSLSVLFQPGSNCDSSVRAVVP